MLRILGMITVSILLSGVFFSGSFSFASSDACGDASDARKQIESLDRKYTELKKNAYSEWETQAKSGAYSGTWDEYAQKFLESAVVKEIQTLRQKYVEIDQKCVQYGPIKSEYSGTKKKSCDTDSYKNIKKTFFAIEQKLIAAKEKHYRDWEAQTKSGAYSGTWDQYAKEHLQLSQEMSEYQKVQVKHGSIIQYCQSEQQPETKTIRTPAGCNESEFESAKKTLSESSNKVSILKEKIYSEWMTLSDSGKTSESWDVYFNQRFDVAPEVKEWRAIQEKFSGVIHLCTYANMEVVQSNTQPAEPKSSLSDKKAEKPKFSKKSESDKDKITKVKKMKKSKKIT